MGGETRNVFEYEDFRGSLRNEIDALANKLTAWVISAPPLSRLREGLTRRACHVYIHVKEITRRTFLYGSEETLHLLICPEEDTRSVSRIRGKAMVKIDA